MRYLKKKIRFPFPDGSVRVPINSTRGHNNVIYSMTFFAFLSNSTPGSVSLLLLNRQYGGADEDDECAKLIRIIYIYIFRSRSHASLIQAGPEKQFISKDVREKHIIIYTKVTYIFMCVCVCIYVAVRDNARVFLSPDARALKHIATTTSRFIFSLPFYYVFLLFYLFIFFFRYY